MDLSNLEGTMRKPPRLERLFIDGPVGRLEAILELPAAQLPLGSVVVCHPHPQHGGTMHKKVSHTLARTFVKLGYAALRFNFRGTQNSEGEYDDGVGELDDALAAITWMRTRNYGTKLWIAGFSFGAAVAIDAAVDNVVDGVVSVAPSITRLASGLLVQLECPWLIVQGDQDKLIDIEKTIEWVNSLLPGPELLIISNAEHFFHGKLVELREAVIGFVA